jgi:hypothetical protein
MADSLTRTLLARAGATNPTMQRAGITSNTSAAEVDWQPFITIKGTGAAATKVIQSSDNWIDLGNFPAISVRFDIAFISAGVALLGETSVAYSGPFRGVISQTAQGAQTYVLGTEPFGATGVLRRYFRWAVQPPAGDWVVCFRIGLTSPGAVVPPPQMVFGDAGSQLPERGFGLLQPWTTITGSTVAAADDIVAPEEFWLDLSREVYAYIEAQTLDMNDGANVASLIIEQAMYREGPWTTVLGPLTTDNATASIKLTMEGPYAVPLQRYVRWRLVAPVAPWHACFRVAARWG